MMKVTFVVSVFLLSIFSVSGSNTSLPVDDVSDIFSKFGHGELTNQNNDKLQDIRKILRQPENFSSGLLDEVTPLRRSRPHCVFSKLRDNGHVTRRQRSDTYPTSTSSTRPRPVNREHLTIDDVSKMFSKFGRGALTNQENDTMQDILKILRQPEYFSLRLLNEATPVRRSIGCLICIGAIKVAFTDVKLGATDEQIATTITMLCYTLNIQTYKVCKGVVALNIPIITYIIKHVPEATPEAFCSLVLQNSANPDECVMNDKRFEWQVDLPDPPSSLTDSIYNDRATPINIIVLTDFHVDPIYEAFGVADCNEPICCRKGQKHKIWSNETMPIDDKAYEDAVFVKDKEIFLNLNGAGKIRKTEIMMKNTRMEIMMKNTRTNKIKARSTPAGYWGDYRSCDTPLWALDDVIERVKETHKNIDIIYYVGDTTDHGVWETTYELIHELNNYTVNKIRETFGDDVLVVPTIGNHESQPCNQFAPSKIKEEKLNTTWLYEELASKWGHYLPDDAKQSLIERGDFSVLYKPGLRIISLNNNVANRGNWWLVYDPTEAKRHLDWLVQELHAAEKANERVHILTHIPPGSDDLIHTWTREYNRIVNRFSKTIAAEFNGHTHADEFKIFYNLTDKSQAINVAWNGGGATTYINFNLNYKVITADPQTYTLQRIENYVYNLTEANLHPKRRPHWFLLYDMKNNFNLEDLSAPSMDKLVHRMVTVEKPLLALYSAFFSKVSDAQMNCNVQCQLDNICNTVITVLWEKSKCDELRSLYIQ